MARTNQCSPYALPKDASLAEELTIAALAHGRPLTDAEWLVVKLALTDLLARKKY